MVFTSQLPAATKLPTTPEKVDITPAHIVRGDGVLCLPGTDIVILHPASLRGQALRIQPKFRKQILSSSKLTQLLPTKIREALVADITGFATHGILRRAYEKERGANGFMTQSEPEWAKYLPLPLIQSIRTHYVADEGWEQWMIAYHVHHHGIGYVIGEGGMTEDVYRTFPLDRLGRVRQLAYLHEPNHPQNTPSIEVPFPHSRLSHSYDVYVNAALIIARNPCLAPIANHILVAALTHDTLTPAGGDATKLIDPIAFDEDVQYRNLLHGEKWEALARKYNLNRDLLISIVLGQGIGGRVLDLADKSAYLACDLSQYLFRGHMNGPHQYADQYLVLSKMSREYPRICALWQYAEVDGENLVITNAPALNRFLHLRARMFKWLYYNPNSRIIEYITAMKVIGWAYHTGRISAEQLLTWGDDGLERHLQREFRYRLSHVSLEQALMEEFPTLALAERRAAELNMNPELLVMVDAFTTQTKNGAKSFCVRKSGKVMTFAEAYPADTAVLEQFVQVDQTCTRVYAINMERIGISDPEIRAELKAFVMPKVNG